MFTVCASIQDRALVQLVVFYYGSSAQFPLPLIEANLMVLAINLSHVSQTYVFFFYSWLYHTSQGLVGFLSLQLQASKINVVIDFVVTKLPLVGFDSADRLVTIHQLNCSEQEIISKETIAWKMLDTCQLVQR